MVRQAPKKTTKRTVKSKFAKDDIILEAKSDMQKEYIKALDESNQVICTGPAGTGKSYVAATKAAQMYQRNEINKIVITRPHVAVGKDIGFLPGSLEEKAAPWALPVIDVLEKHLTKEVVEAAIRNGNIEMVPLALIRGRSFDEAFIICDEAQNITTHEMKAVLTRVGEGSHLVIDGDIMQSDLKQDDGLSKVVHLVKKHQLPVPVIEFGMDDIVRSDVCAMWIRTFYEEGI